MKQVLNISTKALLLVTLALLVVTLPASGASNFLGGQSGNILTPDDIIVPTGTVDLSFHQIVNLSHDNNLSSTGITYGVTPNLEVGASFISNGDSDVTFNGKYRVITETASRPALLVGVYDVSGSANGVNGDPGFFMIFSKNVTSTASDIVGEPSKPLRLTAGLGTGPYSGLIMGLDWTLGPRVSLMADYTGGNVGDNDKLFSAGIRYAVSDTIRLDVAAIDFKDFAIGGNFHFKF